jgi:hypothetical protein
MERFTVVDRFNGHFSVLDRASGETIETYESRQAAEDHAARALVSYNNFWDQRRPA